MSIRRFEDHSLKSTFLISEQEEEEAEGGGIFSLSLYFFLMRLIISAVHCAADSKVSGYKSLELIIQKIANQLSLLHEDDQR